ncbi:uncharacterized protein LOC141648979 [Silene latifolia]|uniref:uncharacterized protein LOC141648979 n=1 Tax=Silene latifolia TaxID=37657 RepID=UPI003D779C82
MITSSSLYDILFLSETKCTVDSVSSLFCRFGFENSVGVDALGSKGGLWVGWKSFWNITCIVRCQNFIILKIIECPSRFWYFCCIYGEPKKEGRAAVWMDLEQWLIKLDSHFVLLGDFNQVETKDDKLGGAKGVIFGAKFFSEWKTRNLLSDIAFKGPKFTWCNNRKGAARLYERIDKGLISSSWYSFFLNTGILHLPIQCSDHAPIILDTEMISHQQRRNFKMESWCFDYTDCLQVLKDEWFKRDKGSPSFKLFRKLRRVRFAFKQWTFHKRREWTQKWTDFDDMLGAELEQIFQGQTESGYEQCHTAYLEFNKAANLFWKQRAKLHWLKDGDACTKYFFNFVRERHKKNFIYAIRQENNVWSSDIADIFTSFETYFKEIYETEVEHEPLDAFIHESHTLLDNLRYTLNHDQHDLLRRGFTRKEVRKAVFQMGSNKSPGPDGIPGVFYQKYWFHIKDDVTSAVLSILNT